MSKPQIHISHVNMFFRCGEQYRRRYIEGHKIPPGVGAIIGTGTHRVIDKNMKHKRDAGSLLSTEEVRDLARDATVEAWEATLTYSDGPMLSDTEKEQGTTVVKAAAIDTTVGLAALHHIELAPGIEPERIEWPWVLGLENYPYDLGGTIDLQEKGHAELPGTLRDTKTTAKAPTADAAAKMLQLTQYALAVWKLDGIVPPLAVDWLVKTKVPKAIIQTTTRDVEDFKMLLARLENMMSCLDKGSFPPCSPDHWLCSMRWCGYYPTCRYVR